MVMRPPRVRRARATVAQLTGQYYTGDRTRGAVYTILAYMATVESIQSYTFYSVLPGLCTSPHAYCADHL